MTEATSIQDSSHLTAKKSRKPVLSVLLLAALLAILFRFGHEPAVVILSLSITTVVLIVFGKRFAIDHWLEKRGIPGREAILPLIALSIALAMGAVEPELIPQVFKEKIDIICLILSFAIISEGIGRSGYFAFAAYKIVQKCQGNTTRLILYLYILTSILTFVTSNDIVVLVLTPIIISVCVHARITNTRLLLLSQFVAANTLSMGLLIGSPTNIILAEALKINFFSYLLLMLVPSILACMLSFILIDWINKKSMGVKPHPLLSDRWQYTNSYHVPAFSEYAHFTRKMRNWLLLFLAAVMLLAVVSAMEWSLMWAAIPIALASLTHLYRETAQETDKPGEPMAEVLHTLHYLPYSILFFGMCFFVFAAELSRLHYVDNVILPFVREHLLDELLTASLSMTLLSGFMVNFLNDLPAAALISELLVQLESSGGALDTYTRTAVIQSLLVGLNIGCYVTPIGALAGLLWFNIIRKEEKRHRKRLEKTLSSHGRKAEIRPLAMPNRTDLVRYGILHFLFVGISLSLLIPFMIQAIDLMIRTPGDTGSSPVLDIIAVPNLLPYLGMSFLLLMALRFKSVLKRNNVLLGHMREIFVFLTRLTIWSMKHRVLYIALLSLLFLLLATGAMYWTETAHDNIYGLKDGEEKLFDSVASFVIWLMVFTGSGLSDAYEPRSTLGLALTSLLPIFVLGSIILITRMSSERNVTALAKRLACGDIPGYRIVVINYQSIYEGFVTAMLERQDASILLLCSQAEYDRALSFSTKINATDKGAYRVYAAYKSPDSYHNFHEFKIADADEIYLLSEMSAEGEYENLCYLTMLDAELNATRMTFIEAIEAGIGGSASTEDTLEEFVEYHAGMPRILIETATDKFEDLVKKSVSSILLKSAIQINLDRDLPQLLLSDMDSSMNILNHYYRMGVPQKNNEIFTTGYSPTQNIKLKSFEMTPQTKEMITGFLNRDFDTEGSRLEIVMHSKRLLDSFSGSTQGAMYINNNGQEQMLIDKRIFGLEMDMSGSRMNLSLPSAILSARPVTVNRIILKEEMTPLEKTEYTGIKYQIGKERFFISIPNIQAKEFVRHLMALFPNSKKKRIFILGRGHYHMPDDILNHPAVEIIRAERTETLIEKIIPNTTDKRRLKQHHLRPGDRLYFFLDYKTSQNPELENADRIDQLDKAISKYVRNCQEAGKEPLLRHHNLCVTAETHGGEGQLLLQNFFVDEIIDSSLSRKSFMTILSKLFHRAFNADQDYGSLSNFRRATLMARYLQNFIVDFAEDITLKNLYGEEFGIIGMSHDEAAENIRAFSESNKQLIARARIVPQKTYKNHKSHTTYQMAPVDNDTPIAQGDLLISLPII